MLRVPRERETAKNDANNGRPLERRRPLSRAAPQGLQTLSGGPSAQLVSQPSHQSSVDSLPLQGYDRPSQRLPDTSVKFDEFFDRLTGYISDTMVHHVEMQDELKEHVQQICQRLDRLETASFRKFEILRSWGAEKTNTAVEEAACHTGMEQQSQQLEKEKEKETAVARRVNRLAEENGRLSSEARRLDAACQIAEKAKSQMQNEIKRLDHSMKHLETKVRAMEAEKQQLQAERDALEADLHNLRDRSQLATQLKEDAEKEVGVLKQALATTQRKPWWHLKEEELQDLARANPSERVWTKKELLRAQNVSLRKEMEELLKKYERARAQVRGLRRWRAFGQKLIKGIKSIVQTVQWVDKNRMQRNEKLTCGIWNKEAGRREYLSFALTSPVPEWWSQFSGLIATQASVLAAIQSAQGVSSVADLSGNGSPFSSVEADDEPEMFTLEASGGDIGHPAKDSAAEVSITIGALGSSTTMQTLPCLSMSPALSLSGDDNELLDSSRADARLETTFTFGASLASRQSRAAAAEMTSGDLRLLSSARRRKSFQAGELLSDASGVQPPKGQNASDAQREFSLRKRSLLGCERLLQEEETRHSAGLGRSGRRPEHKRARALENLYTRDEVAESGHGVRERFWDGVPRRVRSSANGRRISHCTARSVGRATELHEGFVSPSPSPSPSPEPESQHQSLRSFYLDLVQGKVLRKEKRASLGNSPARQLPLAQGHNGGASRHTKAVREERIGRFTGSTAVISNEVLPACFCPAESLALAAVGRDEDDGARVLSYASDDDVNEGEEEEEEEDDEDDEDVSPKSLSVERQQPACRTPEGADHRTFKEPISDQSEGRNLDEAENRSTGDVLATSSNRDASSADDDGLGQSPPLLLPSRNEPPQRPSAETNSTIVPSSSPWASQVMSRRFESAVERTQQEGVPLHSSGPVLLRLFEDGSGADEARAEMAGGAALFNNNNNNSNNNISNASPMSLATGTPSHNMKGKGAVEPSFSSSSSVFPRSFSGRQQQNTFSGPRSSVAEELHRNSSAPQVPDLLKVALEKLGDMRLSSSPPQDSAPAATKPVSALLWPAPPHSTSQSFKEITVSSSSSEKLLFSSTVGKLLLPDLERDGGNRPSSSCLASLMRMQKESASDFGVPADACTTAAVGSVTGSAASTLSTAEQVSESHFPCDSVVVLTEQQKSEGEEGDDDDDAGDGDHQDSSSSSQSVDSASVRSGANTAAGEHAFPSAAPSVRASQSRMARPAFVPKLKLGRSDVGPGSWLSGSATQGDTYVTLPH